MGLLERANQYTKPAINEAQRISDLASGSAGLAEQVFGQAPNIAQFSPFGISSGIGEVSSTPSRLDISLSPGFSNISNLLLGQSAGLLGQRSPVDLSSLGNLAFQTSQAFLPQLPAASSAILQGLGTVSDFTPSSLGNNLLATAEAFNPEQAAQERFNLIEKILSPIRDQERKNLDQLLFSRGQLGSTGGALQQLNFQEAVNRERERNLLNAIQSAEASQSNLVSQGLGLANLGLSRDAQALQRAGFLLGSGLNIGRNAVNTLGTLGAFASQIPELQQSLGLRAIQGALGLERSPLDLISPSLQAGSLNLQAGLSGLDTQLKALAAQQGAFGLQALLPETLLGSGRLSVNAQQLQEQLDRARKKSKFGALKALGGAFLGGFAGPFGTALGGSLFGGNEND